MRIKAEETMALIVDYQESLMKVIDTDGELAKRSAMLIRGLKILNIPMIITQQYTKGLGNSSAFVYEAAGTDSYMDKTTFSCLKDPAIAAAVSESGKKNVLVCGTEAHICVLQTCIDLKAAGYQPVLVTDCIGSRKASDRKAGIRRAVQEGVITTSAEAILFELLEKAGSSVFREISKLVK